jgi:protein phosphatase
MGLFLVADGLGGLIGGELAAQLVIELLPPLLRKCLRGIRSLFQPRASDGLAQALRELNQRVWNESCQQLAPSEMGTTLVCALVREREVLVGHVGDSRAYFFHDQELEQLTTDHTPAQRLVAQGTITPEEAAHHDTAGQLSQYIGMAQEVVPDICLLECQPGNQLLLCSDGLTSMLSDAEIHGVFNLGLPPRETCRLLIDAANLAGGEDNITVVIASWNSE